MCQSIVKMQIQSQLFEYIPHTLYFYISGRKQRTKVKKLEKLLGEVKNKKCIKISKILSYMNDYCYVYIYERKDKVNKKDLFIL